MSLTVFSAVLQATKIRSHFKLVVPHLEQQTEVYRVVTDHAFQFGSALLSNGLGTFDLFK